MLMGRQQGVSLVELMISVAIASILLMAGMPAFTVWMQNAENRTAAEAILNGLQLARVEAVKRNAVIRFDLTDAAGLIAWNVGCVTVSDDCPATIQKRVSEDGLANARVGVSTSDIPYPTPAGYFSTPIGAGTGLEAGVSFNGMGRVVNIGTDISRVDITSGVSNDARRFVVMIGAGGEIRMCDPALVHANNPQGCS